MNQLHLVSDPVVEEIENEGPDCFELVSVVLVVVCWYFEKFQVHDIWYHQVSRVLKLTVDPHWDILFAVLHEGDPRLHSPFYWNSVDFLVENYHFSGELLIHLQGNRAIFLLKSEISYWLSRVILFFVSIFIFTSGTIIPWIISWITTIHWYVLLLARL